MTVLGRIFHQGCERQTTSGQAASGLLAGAAVGAALTALAPLVGFSASGGLAAGVPMAVLSLPVSLVIWAVGLAAATRGWWLLHRLGARCQQAAMLYGVGFTLVAGVWLGPGEEWLAIISQPSETTIPPVFHVALLSLMGAAVGWVVAKVASKAAKAS